MTAAGLLPNTMTSTGLISNVQLESLNDLASALNKVIHSDGQIQPYDTPPNAPRFHSQAGTSSHEDIAQHEANQLLNTAAIETTAIVLTSNSITPDSAVVSSIIATTSAEISSDSSTSSVPGSRPSILPNEASSTTGTEVKPTPTPPPSSNMPVKNRNSTAITDLQELDNALHNALGRSVSTVSAPTRSQIAAFVAAAAATATMTTTSSTTTINNNNDAVHVPATTAADQSTLATQTQTDIKQTTTATTVTTTSHALHIEPPSAVLLDQIDVAAGAQNSPTKLNSPTTPLLRSTSVATFGIGSVPPGDPNMVNPPTAVSHTTLSYYQAHEMNNISENVNGVMHQQINNKSQHHQQQQHQHISHVALNSGVAGGGQQQQSQPQWHGSPIHMSGSTMSHPAALQEHYNTTTPNHGSQSHLCCIQNTCNGINHHQQPSHSHGGAQNYMASCNGGQSCSAACLNDYFTNSQLEDEYDLEDDELIQRLLNKHKAEIDFLLDKQRNELLSLRQQMRLRKRNPALYGYHHGGYHHQGIPYPTYRTYQPGQQQQQQQPFPPQYQQISRYPHPQGQQQIQQQHNFTNSASVHELSTLGVAKPHIIKADALSQTDSAPPLNGAHPQIPMQTNGIYGGVMSQSVSIKPNDPTSAPSARGRQSSPSVLQEGLQAHTLPLTTSSGTSDEIIPKRQNTIGSQTSSPGGTIGIAREKIRSLFSRGHSHQKSTKSHKQKAEDK